MPRDRISTVDLGPTGNAGLDVKTPNLVVSALDGEPHPEVVLVTTLDLDRMAVNGRLREAGFSPLHNIRRIVRVSELPVLGTGKVAYRTFRGMIAEASD